ncbi:hypothetical protein ACFSUD_12125 [Sulfitobacter aestuarii]|uniref:Uncharacterized protein n=1 Tax=Sulfitobacter aestuarii TaxID=2161676 RepID=A0ABW5U3Q8_9RHOB
MSYQPQFPGIFSPAEGAAPVTATPPRPATDKQLHYARALARKSGAALPDALTEDRAALSRWIEAHKAPEGPFSAYPSAKQVAFAERIARIKRRAIPQECFRDKVMMSRWIDGNKP